MRPAPVTRSKGGHRRKPRRITPFIIENYWPGKQRVRTLRRTWPLYKPAWMIVDMLNRVPAPRPVTIWQLRMMASHLKLRRPKNISPFTREMNTFDPGSMSVRLAGVQYLRNPNTGPVRPESANKLRKVGRKPKPKPIGTGRLYAPGLSMGRVRRVPLTPAQVKRKALIARNASIRALYRNGATAKVLGARFGLSHHSIYGICTPGRSMSRKRRRKV